MRLSSLCRDRFNQIKPLSQSRVIWNLNFKSHTWTHFCFKVQTRSAKAEPNESFLRVHEHRFSGAVSSLPNISQYWKMSSRLVFLEGCCAVWREIKWCLTSSSFYYFFRNSNGRATAYKPPKILAKYSTVVFVRKLSNSRPRKTTPKLCFFSLMRFFLAGRVMIMILKRETTSLWNELWLWKGKNFLQVSVGVACVFPYMCINFVVTWVSCE